VYRLKPRPLSNGVLFERQNKTIIISERTRQAAAAAGAAGIAYTFASCALPIFKLLVAFFF
jgi:hypothetical protein